MTVLRRIVSVQATMLPDFLEMKSVSFHQTHGLSTKLKKALHH
ncbi:hypothetical protein QIS74_09181 [Colletotrichum tabaci]|uniref:Uncharacterized protein n=1 Tax=Colletotrichum tabaci TaxID=1209068 RepID=A0AAV9T4L2_9PEZI